MRFTLAPDLMKIALGAAPARDAAAERVRNPLGEPEVQRAAMHRRSVVTAVTALTSALTSHADAAKGRRPHDTGRADGRTPSIGVTVQDLSGVGGTFQPRRGVSVHRETEHKSRREAVTGAAGCLTAVLGAPAGFAVCLPYGRKGLLGAFEGETTPDVILLGLPVLVFGGTAAALAALAAVRGRRRAAL